MKVGNQHRELTCESSEDHEGGNCGLLRRR